MRITICLFILFASGCSLIPGRGRITIPGGGLMSGPTKVQSVKDAGTPATVDTGIQEKSLKIPAGSTIVETRTDAVPATEKTPFQPATTVREIKLISDTTWFDRAQDIKASTGTIDTSVAKHRIDIESRRILLWVGLGCVILAIASKAFIPLWPSVTHGLLITGGILIASWKFAEVPWWAALIVVGLVGALVLGYKRGEWDKDNDGIPDILEKKKV